MSTRNQHISVWLLGIIFFATACSSEPDPAAPRDAIDTADVPTVDVGPDGVGAADADVSAPTDANVDSTATTDVDGADSMDVADTSDADGSIAPAVSMQSSPLPMATAGDDVASVDIDGDGFVDIAVLTTTGLSLWRFDPAQARPPLVFEGPLNLAFAHTGSLLRAGDFDGDERIDLAIYDPTLGKVWVLAHIGAPAAFENPIIAFENPIIAFENPIIAMPAGHAVSRGLWDVGDFNGDGLDDMAFFLGSNGIAVSWNRPSASPLGTAGTFQVAQPSGLSDFENPIIARPITGAALDLDGDGRDELAVAFDRDASQGDGVVLFQSTGATSFENPIIAFGTGGVWIDTPDGLTSLLADDLNLDGAADLAWMGADAVATNFGVWLSDGFENPIIATTPFLAQHASPSDGLLSGRLLLQEPIGQGAAGGPALDTLAARRALIFPSTSGTSFAIATGPQRAISPPLELDASARFGTVELDANHDGFSEFVDVDAATVELVEQTALAGADYPNDVFVLADGSTVPMCELVSVPCTEGPLGVCAFARDICGTCTPDADFQTTFGVSYAAAHEPSGEVTCDGLDNDCDGLVDELPATLADHSGSVTPTLEQHVQSLGTSAIWLSVPTALGAPVELTFLDDVLAPTSLAPFAPTNVLTTSHPVRVATSPNEVAFAGVASANHAFVRVDAAGTVTQDPVVLPAGGIEDLHVTFAFGDWVVAYFEPLTATQGAIALLPMDYYPAGIPSIVTTGTINGVRLLDTLGNANRVYALTAEDLGGSEAASWMSLGPDGAIQVFVPLGLAASGWSEGVMGGTAYRQCVALVDGNAALTLRNMEVTQGASDDVSGQANPFRYGADPVVPGSVHARASGTTCRFWWATNEALTGEVGLHELWLDASGSPTYRSLGSVALGANPGGRLHLVESGAEHALIWSREATPAVFEHTLTCGPPCTGPACTAENGYVRITAGSFSMGTPSTELGYNAWEDEHPVTLTRDYFIKETEVTQAEWEALMGNNPAYFSPAGAGPDCGPDCPMDSVNWYDTLAYCNALSTSEGRTPCYDLSACTGTPGNRDYVCPDTLTFSLDCDGYRLPTEAEWEFAYRGGTTTAFYNGDITNTQTDLNASAIGWYDNTPAMTQPVAQKQPSPLGHYDMAGNVFEWVWDWQNAYSGASTDPLGGPQSVERGVRGGDWTSPATLLRAGARSGLPPESYNSNFGLGFRPVRTAP